jgi:heme o synthase
MTVAVSLEALPRRRPADVARDFVALTKPRVIVLLEITAVAAMVIADRGWPGWRLVLLTVAGGWLAASGANAINCWFDRDIDQAMGRTRTRPLPSGRVEPHQALAFGIVLGAASFVLLSTTVNLLSASLALLALLFYVFIYTMWLKRSTPQNIVIGGAAGAFPPVIGWAAATGSISLLPLLLFAIVFFWTPPHFWALSLYASGDYERAGVPMLPVVKGPRHTRICIMVYTLLLIPIALAPYALGLMGRIYGVSALVLSVLFAVYSWRVLYDSQNAQGASLTNNAPARSAFKFSILYLFLLFGACAVDRLV